MSGAVYVVYRGDEVACVGSRDECVEHPEMSRPASLLRDYSVLGASAGVLTWLCDFK